MRMTTTKKKMMLKVKYAGLCFFLVSFWVMSRSPQSSNQGGTNSGGGGVDDVDCKLSRLLAAIVLTTCR